MGRQIKGELTGYVLTEKDWAELESLVLAIQGTGELILHSGEQPFVPEIKTEAMASIMFAWSALGQRLIEQAHPT